MSTLTPNYGFILPGVNDPTDQDLWGGYLNSNFSSLDTLLKTASDYETEVKTSNYTVTTDDNKIVFLVDATGGSVTISLPTAASAEDGFTFAVKKTDVSANTVIIDPNGAELIDGAATYTLSGQNDSILVVCDATGWKIIAYKTTASGVPAASETVQGIVELATNAEAIAGTDNARAIVPSSLKAVLDTFPDLDNVPEVTAANSGKIVMGPVTVQWGRLTTAGTNTTISYPTAFSGSVYAVYAQSYRTDTNSTGEVHIDTNGNSANNFNLGKTSTDSAFWLAIGPT